MAPVDHQFSKFEIHPMVSLGIDFFVYLTKDMIPLFIDVFFQKNTGEGSVET